MERPALKVVCYCMVKQANNGAIRCKPAHAKAGGGAIEDNAAPQILSRRGDHALMVDQGMRLLLDKSSFHLLL